MSTPSFEYKAGGSLQKDFPGYVTRAADEELFRHAQAGDFCFVLSARQMGKSSLRVRSSDRLQAAGIACASIDITAIGSAELAPGQWYYSFLMPLMRSLKLDRDFRAWWQEQQELTPVSRFLEALRWLLGRHAGRIVVCIDEIDSLLSIDRRVLNPDDFFAALRVCYNLRADEEAWQRLSFVLLGVAAPNDLMSDDTRTPFNIGVPIALSNFTEAEALPLAAGLDHLRVGGKTGKGEALLREVLRWTGGQPYLTQKLCADLARQTHDIDDAAAAVDAQVQQSFLAPGLSASDSNLANTQSRVVNDPSHALPMLGLHRCLLAGEAIAANPRDPAQLYYRLAGMVLDRDGRLSLNNEIYRQVFGPDWLETQYARLDRPLSRPMQRWLDNGCAPAYLLSGVDLDEADTWAAGRKDLTEEERSYLETSRRRRDEERVAEANRKAASEERRRKITFRWAALAAGLAVVTGAAMFWALYQRGQVQDINRALLTGFRKPANGFEFTRAADYVKQTMGLGSNLQENLYYAAELIAAFRYADTVEAIQLISALLPYTDLPDRRGLTFQAWADTVLVHLAPRDSLILWGGRYFPSMVRVEGGTFIMGSSEEDGIASDDERPVHQVTVSDFEIGRTEVTWMQYALFCRSTNRELPEDPSWRRQPSHPVVNVSWEDANAYIDWLKRITAQSYRLPTEAEWEYAAGGGVSGRTNWSGTSKEDSLGSYAWYRVNSENKTHPVGQKEPNTLGLYDMNGNVWEWCSDWYGDYPSGPQTNPGGPAAGSGRVNRGGGWFHAARHCRVAYRSSYTPVYRGNHLGFRLAR